MSKQGRITLHVGICVIVIFLFASMLGSCSVNPQVPFRNVAVGVLVNSLCSIIAALLLWIALGYIVFQKTHIPDKFKSFFNCIAQNKISVVFSNAKKWTTRHEPSGDAQCTCKEGEIESGICSFTEISSINYILKKINEFPGKSFDSIRGLVDSFWTSSMPEISFECSPYLDNGSTADEKILFGPLPKTFIVVGSANKNFVRRHYVTQNKVKLSFCWEKYSHCDGFQFHEEEKALSDGTLPDVLKIDKHNCLTYHQADGDESYYTFKEKYNIAIIEKITDQEKTIFFCNGVRADDSYNAVVWLFNNWLELYKKYPDKQFSICIGMKFSPTVRKCTDEDTANTLVRIVDGKIKTSHAVTSPKIWNENGYIPEGAPA